MEKSSKKKRLSFWIPIFSIGIFIIGCTVAAWLYWRVTSPYNTFYSQLRPFQGKIMQIDKEDLDKAEIVIMASRSGPGSYLIDDEENMAALADYLNRIRFTTWARSDWRPPAPGYNVSIRLKFNRPVPEPKWEDTRELDIFLSIYLLEDGAEAPEDFCIMQMDNARYSVERKYLEEIVQLWLKGRKTESVPLPGTHPMP